MDTQKKQSESPTDGHLTNGSTEAGDSPIWQPTTAKNNQPKGRMLRFASLIGQHRSMLVSLSTGAAIFLLLVSFVLPETYTSQVTLLPPEKGSGGSLMSFLSGSGAGGALDLLGGGASKTPEMDLYKSILESRTISEDIVRDARIRRYFSSFDTSHLALVWMATKTLTAEASRNNIMSLTVDLPTHAMPSSAERDSAKVLSAYLANLYVSVLDRFNREQLMTSARNTRQFVEKEYQNRMLLLDSAYGQLQNFQEANQAISLSDQLSATVGAAAQLGSSVQELEMQIGVEQRELAPNSTRIEMLKAQLAESKATLSKYDNGGAGNYILALKDVPELTRQYAKYFKEVKTLEAVTSYLRQQLEQERISEQRDLPSLQVLDAAIPPQKRSAPHRSTMMIIGLFGGLVVGLLLAAYKNFRRDVRQNPERHIRYLRFRSALLGKRRELAVGGNLSEVKELQHESEYHTTVGV